MVAKQSPSSGSSIVSVSSLRSPLSKQKPYHQPEEQADFPSHQTVPKCTWKMSFAEASSELWLTHISKAKHIVVLLLERKRASVSQLSTSQQVFPALLSLQTTKDCKDSAVMV